MNLIEPALKVLLAQWVLREVKVLKVTEERLDRPALRDHKALRVIQAIPDPLDSKALRVIQATPELLDRKAFRVIQATPDPLDRKALWGIQVTLDPLDRKALREIQMTPGHKVLRGMPGLQDHLD